MLPVLLSLVRELFNSLDCSIALSQNVILQLITDVFIKIHNGRITSHAPNILNECNCFFFCNQTALNSIKEEIICGQECYSVLVTIVCYILSVATPYNIIVISAVNQTRTFALSQVWSILAHLQSSVFKLSKDLIDSIHEEGIVAYTS